jgi:hypothetical protein
METLGFGGTGPSGRWSAHVPTALPKGEEPLVPTEYGGGWAPGPVWKLWTRKESGTEPRLSSPQLSAIPPEVCWLPMDGG